MAAQFFEAPKRGHDGQLQLPNTGATGYFLWSTTVCTAGAGLGGRGSRLE